MIVMMITITIIIIVIIIIVIIIIIIIIIINDNVIWWLNFWVMIRYIPFDLLPIFFFVNAN